MNLKKKMIPRWAQWTHSGWGFPVFLSGQWHLEDVTLREGLDAYIVLTFSCELTHCTFADFEDRGCIIAIWVSSGMKQSGR